MVAEINTKTAARYFKVKDPGKEGGGAIFFAVCRGKVFVN
jgi:hypothetical protein